MPRKTYLTAGSNPLSQVVRAGDTLYLSGHVPIDPATGKTAGDNVGDQTRQTFENLIVTLKHAGIGLDDVVKVNVFLTNAGGDFAAMNAVYREYFPTDPPARTTVGTSGLANPNFLIEIEMIAYAPQS